MSTANNACSTRTLPNDVIRLIVDRTVYNIDELHYRCWLSPDSERDRSTSPGKAPDQIKRRRRQYGKVPSIFLVTKSVNKWANLALQQSIGNGRTYFFHFEAPSHVDELSLLDSALYQVQEHEANTVVLTLGHRLCVNVRSAWDLEGPKEALPSIVFQSIPATVEVHFWTYKEYQAYTKLTTRSWIFAEWDVDTGFVLTAFAADYTGLASGEGDEPTITVRQEDWFRLMTSERSCFSDRPGRVRTGPIVRVTSYPKNFVEWQPASPPTFTEDLVSPIQGVIGMQWFFTGNSRLFV